jgi:cysteine synthase A
MELPGTILDCIGKTHLLPLRHITAPNSVRILLKLESENPTGSTKDRMALAMIEAAEADGRLRPGGITGVSLSLVCAVKRYPLHIVSTDAFSQEKLDHMRILGANLHIVRSEGGGMTEKLTRDMVEAARVITAETGAFWTDQLNNTDQLVAYHHLAEEIWQQTTGRIDAFVQSVGTAASLRGTAEALRRHHARIHIVAVEPEESAVLCSHPPARTRSTASMLASSSRSGKPMQRIRSNASPRRRQQPWRYALPARKACSAAPPPAPTSSPLCGPLNNSLLPPPLSTSCAIQA